MTLFLSVTNKKMSVILRPSFKNISALAENRTNVSHNTSHKTPKPFNSFLKNEELVSITLLYKSSGTKIL